MRKHIAGLLAGLFFAGQLIPGAQAAFIGAVANHAIVIGGATDQINSIAPVAGTVLVATSTSADPSFTATPTIGVSSSLAGSLTIANSTTAFAPSITAPGVTPANYNFVLPLTAGSSGQCLASGGGGTTNMTWSNCTAITVETLTGSSPFTITAVNGKTSIISMATPAASTINLPTGAQSAGWRQCIKDGTTGFGSNNATVKSPTAGTIDGVSGSTGVVMNQAHQELCFLSDGTNWFVE